MAIQQRNLEQLQTFTILSPVVVATDNNTTGVDLSGIDGDALFILNAAASGGAAEIIKVKLQHAPAVGGDYVDVPGGAFSTLANVAGQQKIAVPREELDGFFRLSFTDRASFSAAVSCVAIGAARYAV
jgi:hypothetical protein